jgi:hypothetical protein
MHPRKDGWELLILDGERGRLSAMSMATGTPRSSAEKNGIDRLPLSAVRLPGGSARKRNVWEGG